MSKNVIDYGQYDEVGHYESSKYWREQYKVIANENAHQQQRIVELEAIAEEQRLRLKSLLEPAEEATGKQGSTAILTYIARLEAEKQKYVDTIEAFAEYFNIGCWVLDKGKLDITFTDKEDAVEWYDRMQLINENAALREQIAAKDEALRQAAMFALIASDWHLKEVEIDGEMVLAYDLHKRFMQELEGSSATGEDG